MSLQILEVTQKGIRNSTPSSQCISHHTYKKYAFYFRLNNTEYANAQYSIKDKICQPPYHFSFRLCLTTGCYCSELTFLFPPDSPFYSFRLFLSSVPKTSEIDNYIFKFLALGIEFNIGKPYFSGNFTAAQHIG
ncbi:hypothetical protein ACTXT7_012554 [Hymenolepis weldensis]